MIGRLAPLVLALLVLPARPVGGGPAEPPRAARALLGRLRSSGRAEAVVHVRRPDPATGRMIEVRGRLALELPGLARLDLGNGERLTLRVGGGDWLQPALRQLLRGGPRSAAGALQWWSALLDPAAAGLEERRTGARTFALRVRSSGETAQLVELGADGLPRSVTVAPEGGGRLEYRLSGWRFVRPRGASDFELAPPAGFEVVELP